MNDLISRQDAIDALGERPTVWTTDDEYSLGARNQYDTDKLAIETVQPAQPEPSQVARDIATILENEQDMRVILKSGQDIRMVLKNVRPEQRWIPCSERLPEDGERVLATHLGGLNPDRQVIEHVYANGKFTMGWDMDMNMDSPTFGQRYMGKVIAWMPLPEPYGGEQE